MFGATVAASCGGPGGYVDGPLKGFDDTGNMTGVGPDGSPIEAGQEMTLGWMILVNESDQVITVTDVSLVMGEPGLEIIGGPLVWDVDRRVGAVAFGFEWPPQDTPEWYANPPFPMPEEGFAVHPDDDFGVNVNFGLRFLGGVERATVVGWSVEYKQGDTEYKEFFSSSLAICRSEPCEPEQAGLQRKSPP